MKASQLVKLIKSVVREEVNLAIKENINPLLKRIIKEQKMIKESPSKDNAPIKMTEALQFNNKPKTTNKSKSYVKDPVLNNILNETANATAEWKSMNGTHTSDMAAAMGMTPPDVAFGNGKPTIQEMMPMDRRGRETPDFVSKALTRDYSDLVKAMDKKKK